MTVEFSSSLTQRTYAWSDWKVALAKRNGIVQYDDDNGAFYLVWFYDGPEVHKTIIWIDDVPDDAGLTQEQNDANKAEFLAVYAPISNKSVEPRTTDGRTIGASGKPDGSRANFFTHNWCDATTWYQQSTYVAAETPTDSGDHTTFNLAHGKVVDTYHGKITGEDFLKDGSARSFRVAVTVNGAAKVEQDPHLGSGGDFTIDYENGHVIFLAALSEDDNVRVTYHYAGGSLFTLGPAVGKRLVLDLAEVQFSADVGITDSVRYNAFGYVDVFAPQLMSAPYNIPSGTKIPLGNDFIYKTMADYLNDSIKAYPAYPATGGESWRGSPASLVFDWDYIRALILSSAAGMEIRIWLEHDVPFSGKFATVSFYAGSVPE